MSNSYDFLGFLAGSIGVAFAFPQLWKIVKHKKTEGVSLTAWLLGFVSNISWAIYGFRVHALSQSVTNFVIAIVSLAILITLIKEKHTSERIKVILITFIGSLLAVIAVWVLPLAGVFIVLMGLTLRLAAQAWLSIKNYFKSQQTEVSLLTYWIMLTSNIIWVLYGILANLWINIAGAVLVVSMSVTILAFETLNKGNKTI
jgi:uncharacterized protein with PQ loop repeat